MSREGIKANLKEECFTSEMGIMVCGNEGLGGLESSKILLKKHGEGKKGGRKILRHHFWTIKFDFSGKL